jgi:transposase-like protein
MPARQNTNLKTREEEVDKQKQQSKAEQKPIKATASLPPSSTPAVTAPVPKKTTPSFTAQQKVEAVLSVWSERRSPSEVCRAMGVAWTILNQWQERALEGMLQALESRVNLDKGPALSTRLRQMLQKKAGSGFPLQKLQQRLKDAQQGQKQAPLPQSQP